MLKFVKTLQRQSSIGKPSSSLLTEKEAATFLGVSIYTVQRERKRGNIGFTWIGSRARYSSVDLHAYLDSKSSKPCQKNDLKSGDTSSPATAIPPSGKSDGSTPPLDKHAAYLLAQKTFLKPKKPLPSSS